MPIEIESPVSRSTSSIPERLPWCVARAGSADSLKSFTAWFSSAFLNLDRITPAYISHLHERKCAWNGGGQKEVPLRDQVLAASPLLRHERPATRAVCAPSRGCQGTGRRVGNECPPRGCVPRRLGKALERRLGS